MPRNRTSRAATASRGQQAANSAASDFGFEEEEVAMVITSPDAKRSVSLGDALRYLNPQQKDRFIESVGQDEMDQILQEEDYSRMSPQDLFNNEKLLKSLEIWSPPTFNDDELEKRFMEENRRLDNLEAGILEIRNHYIGLSIEADQRPSNSFNQDNCRSLDLKEPSKETPGPSSVFSSKKTISPEKKEVAQTEATPLQRINVSKLSMKGKKRFKLFDGDKNPTNNNHLVAANVAEDSFDKLILSEEQKTKKNPIKMELQKGDNDHSDDLFGEKVVCPLCGDLFDQETIEAHADTCGEDGAIGGEIPKEKSEGESQKMIMKNGKYECQKCYRLFTRVAGIKGHRCNNDDDN